ncbi:MAG TPA: hypothetical protein VF982_02655 [Anaerolineales bacterium]
MSKKQDASDKKAAKAEREQSNPKQTNKHASSRTPLLLETVFTIARLLILLLAVMTAVSSLLAGNPPATIALRTGLAILASGALAYVAAFLVSSASVAGVIAQLAEAGEHNRESSGTSEWKA